MNFIIRTLATLTLVVILAWLAQACSVQTYACASTDTDQCLQPSAPEPPHCVVTEVDASCDADFQSYKISCEAPIVNPVGLGCWPARGADGIAREVDGAAAGWCCK